MLSSAYFTDCSFLIDLLAHQADQYLNSVFFSQLVRLQKLIYILCFQLCQLPVRGFENNILLYLVLQDELFKEGNLLLDRLINFSLRIPMNVSGNVILQFLIPDQIQFSEFVFIEFSRFSLSLRIQTQKIG